MRRIILFVLCVFVLYHFVYAQNVGIQGVAYNANTGEVLVGANIQILDSTIVRVTNSNGRYIFANLPAGEYNVRASYVGFESQTKKVVINDKTVTLHFELTESSDLIDEVVVTGTGTMHNIRSVPVMTEVINKKFLSMYAGQSIEEILAGLSPSFDFNQNIMGSNIQMNGLGNQYILILLNGERLHGDIGGQNILGWINPADIEKIEIVKGASSSLYGSEAIAGVINIITKKPTAKLDIVNNSRYASFNTINQNNSISVKFGKLRSTTRLNMKHSDGWQNTKNEWYRNRDYANSVTKTVNEFTDYKINQKLEFEANKRLSANVEGSYYRKAIKRPTGEPQYVTYGMTYKSQALSSRVKYKLNDQTYFTLKSSFNRTKYYHNYTHTTIEEHILKNGERIHPVYDPGDNFMVNKQERIIVHGKAVFPIAKHQIISTGVEFRQDWLKSPFRLLSRKEADYSVAAYLQNEFNITKNFNITGGLRFIKHEEFGLHITPKISLLQKWKHINLRATWSQGFKTPSIKELHYHYERTMMSKLRLYLGNKDLKPETSDYFSFATEYNTNKFSISATAYYNELKDMITLMEIPTAYKDKLRDIEITMQYKNIEDAKIKGIEFIAKYKPVKAFRLGASYSYLEANGHFINEDNEIEETVINGTANHRANVYATWLHSWDKYKLGIGLFGKGQSKRYYRDYGDADGYMTLRLNTQHKFLSLKQFNMELNIGIDNILDYKEEKPYGYNYATKTHGRTFYINLIINFKNI